MEFIREGLNLPVPFNIIPMPALVLYLFKRLLLCCYKDAKNTNPLENDIEMPQAKENGAVPNGKIHTNTNNNQSNLIKRKVTDFEELFF